MKQDNTPIVTVEDHGEEVPGFCRVTHRDGDETLVLFEAWRGYPADQGKPRWLSVKIGEE